MTMANIVCKDCKTTGISKCPNCRSVFWTGMGIKNQLVSNLVSIENLQDKDKMTIVTFRLNTTHISDLVHFFKDDFPTTEIASILCNHPNVTFAPGEISGIGCGCS